MDSPLSPPARRLRRPSWLDPRLIGGGLLIVLSMVTGSMVVSSVGRSAQVWAVTRDVAANTVLVPDDLRSAQVRLYDSALRYLGTGRSPVGQAVTRELSAGELLPAAALRPATPGVAVNLPVRQGNAPPVERGQVVDVWGAQDGGPRRIVAAAVVQDVRSDDADPASAGVRQVVVRVGRPDAERLLTVLYADSTIRLVAVAGAPAAVPAVQAPGGRTRGQARAGR